jgi:hypothetical protein
MQPETTADEQSLDARGRRRRASEAGAGATAEESSGQPGRAADGRASEPREPRPPDRRVTRRRVLAGVIGAGAASAGGVALTRLGSDGSTTTPTVRASAPVGGVTAAPSLPQGSITKIPSGLLSIYGAPNSFGDLDSHATVATEVIPGWGFGPGQAAFMSAVAPDGTVFVGTTPFTDDQSKPTGAGMEIAVFAPESRTFSRLVIPSSTGRTTESNVNAAYRGVGGGDVADVQVVPDPDGGERVVFVSGRPFFGWDVATDGQLPSIGQLRPSGPGAGGGDGGSQPTGVGRAVGWSYDPAASWTADQLASGTDPWRASMAFPKAGPLEPRTPRGPASVSRLPRSGHLVVAQYFGVGSGGTDSGALLVLDLEGRVRGFWQYPPTAPLGIKLVVSPREVVADPTSVEDDERFVLISDCRGLDYSTHPFPIQEFSYAASTGAITPKSTAVRAVQDGSRMETAAFDAAGTLYVARTNADGLRAGTLAVYPKVGRERGLVSRTPAVGNWPADSWGIECRPDFLVARTDRGGLVRSMSVDPKTGAVLLAGLDGLLQVVRPAGAGSRMTFSVDAAIDVGLNRLRGPSTRYVGVRRGSVDQRRRILWLPVNQMVLDGIQWPYPPFKLDQWLLRVDLTALLGS